ncbi:MAG: hypothetical protein AB8I08_36710 [Sandaracinaceae bacterium]
MSTRRYVCLLALALVLAACGEESGDADGGPPDAAVATDAGALDSGLVDAGSVDASSVDSGSSDGGPVDSGSSDGGPVDSGSVDSGAADAGSDAGACGCIEATLSWRFDGGFVPSRAGSRIDVCRDFAYARTVGTGPTVMCEDEVPCTGDEVTIGDVNRALADPQVQLALTGTPVFYGRDTRPFDGRIFIIEYRGREIMVGSSCAGTSDCTPVPAGIEALKDLLESLEDERLEAERCASVFPPT